MTLSNLPVFSFHHITLGYGSHPVIHDLSGQITQGTMLAIVGPNGGGKSTLLKACARLLTPLSGIIDFHRFTPKDVAYLPQLNVLDRLFPLRVRDVVGMGLWHQLGIFGRMTEKLHAQVDHALDEVGMRDFCAAPLHALSGGQFQRVLFARLVAQGSPIILLDEPFASLDPRTINDLMILIHRWHQQGKTILVVLHDLDLVQHYFPQTLVLSRRNMGWGTTQDILTTERIKQALSVGWSS